MLRRQNTRTTKGNENDLDEISLTNNQNSQGNKQFGLSNTKTSNKHLPGRNETALKIKSNNQLEGYSRNNNQEKQKLQKKTPSLLPLKRTDSTTNLSQRTDVKKPSFISVERTHRHREEESEWEPEDLDLDFSSFNRNINDSNCNTKDETLEINLEQDSFPTIQRQFNSTSITTQADGQSTLANSDDSLVEIELDITRVEYAPPKEKEPSYIPDDDCIVDFTYFSGYADFTAYELSHLFAIDKAELPLLDDEDALQQISVQLLNTDNLEFDYDLIEESDYQSEEEEEVYIPYNDYTFDVEHFIQCN